MEAIQRRKGNVSEMHKEETSEEMTNQSTTTEPALEPCPLCPDGGKPYFTKTVNGTNMAYVGCGQCGVQLKAQVQFLTSREDWTLSKDIIAIWNTRSRVSAEVAPVVDDDAEAPRFSVSLNQLETRFKTATSHDEIVTLVWACRALLDEDAECAPFFTPEAQDRQMVHAATLRLYFEHAERVLGRQPYPAEVDEIETGFCTPRGQKDVIAKLERGRKLLAAIESQSTAPASTVAPQQSDETPSDVDELLFRLAAKDCEHLVAGMMDCTDELPFVDWCVVCQSRGLIQKYSRANATPNSPAALRENLTK